MPLYSQCPDGTPPPCARAPVAATSSVAVLYFEVRSPAPGDSAFADGLTEAIIDELGADARLQVASRYAVRRFRGASLPEPAALGRTLGSATLVTGVVQRAGPAMQVRIELLSAANGRQLWREPFEAGAGDAFALQRDIAQRVATSIAGRLAGARPAGRTAPTADTAAYNAYLRGNGLMPLRTERSMRAATTEYSRAVARDPRFAGAWARLAVAYAVRLQWADPVAARGFDTLAAAGLRAADRAVALAPRSADAWAARAYILLLRNFRDLAGVQEAFDQAFALDARNAEAWAQYADFLRARGLPGRLEAQRRALAADPARAITLINSATDIGGAEGLLLADSAIAMAPSLHIGYGVRGTLLLWRGDSAGARASYQTAVGLSRADGQDATQFEVYLALASGDSALANRLLRAALARYRTLPVLSLQEGRTLAVLAMDVLGDHEATLDLMRRITPRGASLYLMLRNERFSPLSSDPHFQALLNESRPPWAGGP